jgi:hypothetical protein
MPSGSDAFRNPLTESTYRLRMEGDTWRITKTVKDGDAVSVRHLRGTTADGVVPPADAVDRLVRGEHQRGDPIATDPAMTFAEIVLVDLDRTSSVLTALATEARDLRASGSPGFRPGCSALRVQERDALARAVDGCRQLAAAWSASGLSSTIGLPAWLSAALGDLDQPASDAIAPP